jgi:hemerythrin-like domain-containing protein
MLERSHRRLEHELDALAAASAALAGEDRADAIGRVDAAIDYFARSAARHEVDEEGSLFPRLRRHPELAALLDALTDEHEHHQRLHGELIAQRAAWPPDGPDAVQIPRMIALIDELAAAYRAHIAREEASLFPAARAHLDATELAAVLTEMEARRGRGGGGGGGAGGGGGGGGRRQADGGRRREL